MIKLSSSQIAELGKRAREHFQQGRLIDAAETYERLSKLHPRDPNLWHMLSVVYGTIGDAENAVRCARQTTLLAPSVVSGYRNLGHFLFQLGRAQEAEACFRKAVSLSGRETMDLGNLGAALAAQQRYADAIPHYEQAVAKNGNDPALHYNLAASFHALGHWTEAARHYARASQLAPAEPSYLVNLAGALRASGQDEQALAAWSQLLQLVPNDLAALLGIGDIYREHGQHTSAAQSYTRAVEVAPGEIDPLIRLGLTHLDLGNTDMAQACFRDILSKHPRHVEAQYNLALSLERSGLNEAALEAYKQVPLGDHGLDLIGSQAGMLEKLGEFAAAHALLEPLIASGVAGLRALDSFGRLCRHFGDCDRAIESMEARLQSGSISEEDQRLLHFRLGTLYDRQKNYSEAFKHFESGNRKKQYRYNVADDERYVDKLIQMFSPEVYARIPSIEPVADVTPIFIVGMPRSGTTLVEQILASHPEVYAGDELPFITRIANTPRVYAGRTLCYPDWLPFLTQTDCEEMAQAYLSELRTLAPGARYVTDKMPHNFPFLGLMHRLFPNAPIIHCLRDPADVCLSCYFQDFASYHNYAYDLAHLGQHFCQYQRTLAHFRETLSVPIFESQYESLVDDPEVRSRALLEHCGLSWDERCLRFYESDRKSKTASYDQVRQPIYKRSSQRWRNYEQYLQPLFDALASVPVNTGTGSNQA